MVATIGEVFAIGSVVYKPFCPRPGVVIVHSGIVEGISLFSVKNDPSKVRAVYQVKMVIGKITAEILFDSLEKAYAYGVEKMKGWTTR